MGHFLSLFGICHNLIFVSCFGHKRCGILTCLKSENWKWSHSVVSDSLRPHGPDSPWDSPGQNTGVGSLALLQGTFLTQGSNPGLPHCRRILYQLSHKRNPTVLEWVGYPFSTRSSWPRNRTRVSCIAGGFFSSCALREALTPLPGIEPLSPAMEGEVLTTWSLANLFEIICLAYALEEEETFCFYQSVWEEMESILL